VNGSYNGQQGYLHEFPILVFICALAVLFTAPYLPSPYDTVLYCILGIIVITFIIYHYFFAGYLPPKE